MKFSLIVGLMVAAIASDVVAQTPPTPTSNRSAVGLNVIGSGSKPATGYGNNTANTGTQTPGYGGQVMSYGSAVTGQAKTKCSNVRAFGQCAD